MFRAVQLLWEAQFDTGNWEQVEIGVPPTGVGGSSSLPRTKPHRLLASHFMLLARLEDTSNTDPPGAAHGDGKQPLFSLHPLQTERQEQMKTELWGVAETDVVTVEEGSSECC